MLCSGEDHNIDNNTARQNTHYSLHINDTKYLFDLASAPWIVPEAGRLARRMPYTLLRHVEDSMSCSDLSSSTLVVASSTQNAFVRSDATCFIDVNIEQIGSC